MKRVSISPVVAKLPPRKLKKWISERKDTSVDWEKEIEKLKDDSRTVKKSEED